MTTTSGKTECQCPGCRVLDRESAEAESVDVAGALFDVYHRRLGQVDTAMAFAKASGVPTAQQAADSMAREASLLALAARMILVLSGGVDPLALDSDDDVVTPTHDAPPSIN